MTASPVTRRRRRPLLWSAGLLLVAALVAAGWLRRQGGRSGTPPVPPTAAAGAAAIPIDGAGTFEVASATGTVEAQRQGAWVPIREGDTLTRADVVRTQAKSGAILRFSAGTEIELRERVEIGLDRLPGGAAVDLRRGKLLARVSASDALAITARQTKTSNDGFARFVVLADEEGRVSVAALEGSARFSAGGKSVRLPEGTESRSQAGAPPTDPERIPEEVFLDVLWPTDRPGEHADIEGRAAPSTTVTVNGTRTNVGPDGRFSSRVKLREGKNLLEVEAESLSGQTRRASTTLVRRPPRPALTPEATDLWKK
jgi:hypothetical protein